VAKEDEVLSVSSTLDPIVISTARKRFDDAQKEKERLEAEKQLLLRKFHKKLQKLGIVDPTPSDLP
jgi:hypothetical protein